MKSITPAVTPSVAAGRTWLRRPGAEAKPRGGLCFFASRSLQVCAVTPAFWTQLSRAETAKEGAHAL